MVTSFKYLNRDVLHVSGADNGKHARDVAEQITTRTTTLVTHVSGDTYEVGLNRNRPTPDSIIQRAKARGLYLDRGRLEWDTENQKWTVDKMTPDEWMDIYAPVDPKLIHVIARRWSQGNCVTAPAKVVGRITEDAYLVEFLADGPGGQQQAAYKYALGVALDDMAALDAMEITGEL